jgi:hypothetical protein
MISSTIRKVGPFSGTGLVSTYPFSFKVFTAADLKVVQADSEGVETVLTLNSTYTASLNANQDSNPGGSITLTTALPTGSSLIITTDLAETQGVQLTDLGGFYPAVLNSLHDKIVVITQQLQEQINRCLKLPITDSASAALATKVARANTLLGFDADGVPGAMSTLPVGATISNGILEVNGAKFKGIPTYDVGRYGAICDGSTDDTAAVQLALDACVATGGVLQFPYGTCYIAGTVSHTQPNNVWIRGAGTILKGPATAAAATGPILRLGDPTGVLSTTNLSVSGITVTNGAWNSSTGGIIAGQTTQDAIQAYCTKLSSFDITGVNVGGAVLFLGGNLGVLNPAEWNHVRIRAFDIGIGLSGFYHSCGAYDVQARRAHSNGVFLYNTAQIRLSVTVDECLRNQAAPGTFDGVGVFLRDFDWGTVSGTSGIAYSEALKLYGNSKWNTIMGNFYDSSTSANGATSNITLVTDGTNSPMNNRFNVYAGWTGTGSSNKPAYGLNQVNGSLNSIGSFDATGVLNAPGYTGTNLQLGGNWQGSTGTAMYYNPTNIRTELHGLNSLKFDIDTDTTAGGTPVFIVSSRNGTANLINATLGSGTTFDTSVNVKGGTSGSTALVAQSVASGTLSLPATSDTLVGRATTDTLTNKTLTAPDLLSPRSDTLRLTAAAPAVAPSQVGFGATVATTVGAAGGASALPATPLGYLIANVAGTAVKIPYYNS